MAGRGPRTGDARDTARPGQDAGLERGQTQGLRYDDALVRIHDLAGRPRGTGFVADHHGTVVTSHETVDGLPRLVLHATGHRGCVVAAEAVTPLPDLNLALVHTEGLDVDPLPVTARDRIDTGTYVRVPAGCWREARVLGTTGVTYAATGRSRHLEDALELAIGTAGRDALRLGGGAAGGPVLDARTGAVVGVLGTALHSDHREAAFAVPLRPPPNGPLADLLTRNATTVPAYGTDLNLAGVLELMATSVTQDGPEGVLAGFPGRARCGAAKVSGQIHEAARRSLGPGQGELDRTSFETVFPWGLAPARLGGGTGWASAVLTEGLLAPTGTGYRFAHEELADWLQGMHLDLDEALRALVHSHPGTPGAHPLPHHRIGPVVEALLHLARRHGTPRLAHRLEELAHALDADPDSWWAARLLAEVLPRVPDATPYTAVLLLLTDRIVTWRRQERPVPAEFGPDFWTVLPLPQHARVDLLRRLVLADGPPRDTRPRYLDAAARLLAADPTAVQPHLTRWFDDERPLPATPHATVAKAAQALLHTHRHRALDDLLEVLLDSAHRRADELLAVLAEDEPSAVCRAVDRWARDERPARRAAAMAYGLRTAPHVRTEADRELLRHAALTLLASPADHTLHGGALALLVRDPRTRERHLPQALGHFAAGDPQFPPSALVPALTTDPDQVLDAFRSRLQRPDAGEALRALADVTTPAPARRVAALVREAVEQRPETAAHVASYVDRRLEYGSAARAVLLPLVTGLLDGGPEQVRAALAAVLAAPGTPASRPLRQELLEFLLNHENDPSVLIAVLYTAARHSEAWATGARDLIHRTGLLLVRTPQGTTRFDRGLVDLSRHVPGFAALVAGWLTETPDDWAAVVGPSTRRMIENLAGVRIPA